jgi:hypothetical protein
MFSRRAWLPLVMLLLAAGCARELGSKGATSTGRDGGDTGASSTSSGTGAGGAAPDAAPGCVIEDVPDRRRLLILRFLNRRLRLRVERDRSGCSFSLRG